MEEQRFVSSEAFRADDQRATARAAMLGRSASERMTFLDAMKATGIVMVVAVHVLSRVQLAPAMQEGLLFLVGAVAVPLFLVSDGFLFAHQWAGKDNFLYGAYIRKSVRRLLLPWAVFSILYLLMRFASELNGLVRETIILGKGLSGLATVFYYSELSHHMYFLLSLFLVRLGTVAVKPMLRYSGGVWFGLTLSYIALYVSSNPKRWFPPGADPVLLAMWGMQFYLLGVVLRKWHEQIKPTAGWIGLTGLGLATLGWFVLSPTSSFLVQLTYLVGMYGALLKITAVTSWKFTMGYDTMGIYLLHAPYVVWIVVAVLSSLAPTNHLGVVVVASISTAAISWGISRVLGKYSFGRLLLGHVPLREPRLSHG
jgi:fucose 4-O-acetylase-like acetyltransferase